MGLVLKIIFHYGTFFVLPGLVLMWMDAHGKLDRRPLLRWSYPGLISAGIGMYIPQWFWQDSAVLVFFTFLVIGVNALVKYMTGKSIRNHMFGSLEKG